MPLEEPADPESAARTLGNATTAGDTVVIRGGGTKIDWGGAAADGSIVLSTLRLDRLLAHRDGDLTATIESGATLAAVNRELSRRGQWLPLDPLRPERATIGGLIASNDAGPRRHRYGAPRDLIIGIEIARSDGVRAKAGGIVVKNVAGYDLARLMTGSFGTLALVLSATFKLYPLPAASRTVVVELPTHAAAGDLVRAVNSSQLTPSAVELETHPICLLVRFESTDRSAQHQAEQALQIALRYGGRGSIAAGAAEERAWDAHVERPWTGRGVVMKVTALPSSLATVLDAIDTAADGREWEAIGRAGLGVLLVRVDVDGADAVNLIRSLRASRPAGAGSVVLRRASREVREAVGPALAASDALSLMRAVKNAFDPHGTLPGIETLG